MPFNAGEMAGPYRIIEQLGQGGMASVYKAYHAALDRYVALKVLHPAFLEDPNFLARFQREARLVAKLDHPNIVPIFDYSEYEGRPYLVMKYIEGETLKARLTRGPISSYEISRIMGAVGAALSYAHKHGILHRDIKPSNVLLANDGGIYLADFGLARIAATGESTLSTDMVMGTPQYVSPEQALGKKDLDEGTDIYSLGVMLYELVVGKVPFNADTPFSIIHDHIYTPLPMPSKVNPQVSAEVERVLLKALAKERRDRYPDIDSFVTAFNQVWTVKTLPVREELPAFPADVPTLAPLPATMAQTAVPEAGTVVPPPPPLPVSPQPAQAVPVKGTSKKGFPWMWAAVGVVLFLGCVVTLFALAGFGRKAGAGSPQPASGTGAPSALTSPGAVTASSPAVAVAPPSTASAATAPAVISITDARALVAQHPNDPNAHIQLALAYYANNEMGPAENEVITLESLLKGEIALWDASQKFANQGAWLLAARLRIDAVAALPLRGKEVPAKSRDQLHMTVYRAAADQDANTFLPFDKLSSIDQPLTMLVNARYAFYFQSQGQGQSLLDQLEQSDPNMPEAELLQAEFDARIGQYAAARQSLTELDNNPGTTEWIRAAAALIKGAIH
ncbi:MAG: protein kinase [Anaerolineales bacterium]|jgi:serine/threonine-protein kinase